VSHEAANNNVLKETIASQFLKLLTANLVVRLSNFSMWKVSTSTGKVAPQEFISGKSNYVEPVD
jgi:hypothetical protein